MRRIGVLEKLGREITPAMVQGTIALYAGGALRPTPERCTVKRNLAYGPDERQCLDVFLPSSGQGNRPVRSVLMFVHGGGFVAGDKGAPEAPFYNNIGAWAALHGFIGVTITYRLAPAYGWPSGSDDVANAVRFVRANCQALNADANAIFVMGQSAGAAHVAGYLAHPQYEASSAVAGAILMSGMYDFTELGITPMQATYFGTDIAQHAARSTVQGLTASAVPCLYSIAEFDPDHFQQQTGQIIKAHLRASGRLPHLQYYAGHNHVSPAMAIGAGGDIVGPTIADFIERQSS